MQRINQHIQQKVHKYQFDYTKFITSMTQKKKYTNTLVVHTNIVEDENIVKQFFYWHPLMNKWNKFNQTQKNNFKLLFAQCIEYPNFLVYIVMLDQKSKQQTLKYIKELEHDLLYRIFWNPKSENAIIFFNRQPIIKIQTNVNTGNVTDDEMYKHDLVSMYDYNRGDIICKSFGTEIEHNRDYIHKFTVYLNQNESSRQSSNCEIKKGFVVATKLIQRKDILSL